MKIKEWCRPEHQDSRIGNHIWSVSRLIELSKSLPVMEVPLDHLNVAHRYEFNSLREFVTHMKAVMNADLTKPIILDEDGEIMDGRHRIMKALHLGKKTIKAVRFDENPSPDRIKEDA